MTRPALLSLFLLCAACSKSEPSTTPPEAGTAPNPNAQASAAAASATAKAVASPGEGAAAGAFVGTYALAPAKMYIPDNKDWASVRQAKDEPTVLVGEGALTLALDAKGRVHGTVDSGPAAPATLEGSLVDSELRAYMRRKDPNDDGLTGMLFGTMKAAGVEGTLHLAGGNAAVVRGGTFSLKKK